MAAKPAKDILIHCDACGEDYSSTYRRCPFCGAKNDPRRNSGRDDPASASRYIPTPPPAKPRKEEREEEAEDGYVFDGQDAFDDGFEDEEESYAPRPKGGKRLAPKQGGGFDLPPINWPRLITFLCSLIIIVAALVIVFTMIYPKLHGNEDPKPDSSSAVSAEPSVPPAAVPTPGATQPAGPVGGESQPPVESTPPVSAPAVTDIVLKNSDGRQVNDITLYLGSSAQLTATVAPAGWTGEVTWTSLSPEYITVTPAGVDANGNSAAVVTNVNNSGSFHNVYLTVSAGDLSVQCVVRASSISQSAHTSQPPVQATTPPASDPPAQATAPASTGGNPTVGRSGTIVGADGGLRVRSGPGTNHAVLGSLRNGDSVTVVADAGDGWYQITYAGSNGTQTGYVMGEYISTN